MAHVKSGGRARQGTPRAGNRLGVKLFGGQEVKTGQIIVRQRGSSFHSGEGCSMGKDYTVFALRNGKVKFKISKSKRYIEVI